MQQIFSGDNPPNEYGVSQKKSIFGGDDTNAQHLSYSQPKMSYQPTQSIEPIQEKKSIFGGTSLANPNSSGDGGAHLRTPQKQSVSQQFKPSPAKMVTTQNDVRDSYQLQGFSNPLHNQNQGGGPIGFGNQAPQSVRGSNANALMPPIQQQALNQSRTSHNQMGFSGQQLNAMGQTLNAQFGNQSVKPTPTQIEAPVAQPLQEFTKTPMGEVRPSTVLKVDPIMKESLKMGNPEMLPYFNEKRIVVTGASSGIGRAVAMWFLNSGAYVALVGRDLPALAQIGSQFRKQALVIKCDLGKDNQTFDMTNAIIKEFGGVDIVVNAAGYFLEGDIKSMHPKDFDKVMDVNLRSVFQLAYNFRGQLIKSKGCIVNISGQYGNKPFAGLYAYCMAKAGIEALTKNLAFEMAPFGVRVNCVSPGMTDSNFLRARELDKGVINEAQENAANFNPMKRIASVDDIGKAVVFMCSEAASHITGQVLKVDGGRSLTTSGWHQFIGSKYVSPPIESKESIIDVVKGYIATPQGPFFYSTISKRNQRNKKLKQKAEQVLLLKISEDKIAKNLQKTNWSTTDQNAHEAVKDTKYQNGESRYDPLESADMVNKAFQNYQNSVRPGQQF